MKEIVLILFISLFFQITSRCQDSEFSRYEECFSAEIIEEEINSGGSVDDYTCCYLRQLPSQPGECLLVKNTDKSTYTTILDQGGIPHEIWACSEDELPDQSRSDSCFLLSPLKEKYCFTRTISDSEKGGSDFPSAKCCYIAFNNMEECMPVDSSDIDKFKKEFIESHQKYGYVIENLEVLCGDTNGNSSKDSNNPDEDSSESFAKIFGISYFIWLIILLV